MSLLHDFHIRLARHHDELRWLYMELYDNGSMFYELLERMRVFDQERAAALREIDNRRLDDPDWYRAGDLTGMMLYIDNFGGNMRGVREKLDYLGKSGINYIHLMSFLDTVPGRSDGGYAVRDFRKVQEKLGTMDDLEALTAACHAKNICVCMDFVMNHTSEDHEWARRARAGDGEYMSRYFFYDNDRVPAEFEKTVPQVFPTTAPGNFTYLPELGHYVMTTFYPYQWDLNYANPRVFNEMMANFLYLANRGIDVIRIDAVPYIWKEPGTSCRNLGQVHTIVRMMRMIGEIVCPGVLLLGEVVMEPARVVPYFGTVEKPECHMLYNVTTMATTWHTVATRDTTLLREQLQKIFALPRDYVFLNYLRCHDDIGWGLDYESLACLGIGERAHKAYLNAFFRGLIPGSISRGELYNEDHVTGDARLCGTTASLCGLQTALENGDADAAARAIRTVVMLHAYMFTQSGIPVLYSGDEIGQCNDEGYRLDPWKAGDSRYLHRGAMDWEAAEKADDPSTPQGRIFTALRRLETIRASEETFTCAATAAVVETGDRAVLGIRRTLDGETVLGLFNFADADKTVRLSGQADYTDLLTGQAIPAGAFTLPSYGFLWLKKQ